MKYMASMMKSKFSYAIYSLIRSLNPLYAFEISKSLLKAYSNIECVVTSTLLHLITQIYAREITTEGEKKDKQGYCFLIIPNFTFNHVLDTFSPLFMTF